MPLNKLNRKNSTRLQEQGVRRQRIAASPFRSPALEAAERKSELPESRPERARPPRDVSRSDRRGKGGQLARDDNRSRSSRMSYAAEDALTEVKSLRRSLPRVRTPEPPAAPAQHVRPVGGYRAKPASHTPLEPPKTPAVADDAELYDTYDLDYSFESLSAPEEPIIRPEPEALILSKEFSDVEDGAVKIGKEWQRHSGRAVGGRRTSNLAQLPKQPADPQLTEEEEAKLASLEMRLPRVAGRVDSLLLIVVLALVCIGLVMVYSASSFSAARDFGDAAYYFQKQLMGAVLGVAVMLVTMRIDYRVWRRFSLIGLIIALPLLAIVLVVGSNAYGATRWLQLGFFSFQPSELIKLVLALYIADWLARKGNQVGTFLYGLTPFVILVGLIIGLVLLQKDMGTACVIAAMAVVMFFTAGANIFQFLLALGGGFLVFMSQAFRGYRYYRLIGFLQPFQHTTDINLQLYQSLLALGSGGWLGVGLGASRQKTGYLPFPFIDSIFAIIGEELGFIGCMVIIALFVILAFRGFRLARRTQDIYGALLATGITTWLVIQAMINIGASTGTIPYTGVPLPFISYGGTSMVISLAGCGILLSISRYIQRPDDPTLSRQTIEKIKKRRTK